MQAVKRWRWAWVIFLGAIGTFSSVLTVRAAPEPPPPPPIVPPLGAADLTFTTSWYKAADSKWYQRTVVVNQGSLASPPTSIQLWTDAGAIVQELPALAPGTQAEVGLTAPLIDCTAAAIDPANTVVELREDNNRIISWSEACGKRPF